MFTNISTVLNRYPDAAANVRGEPNIKGQVKFYKMRDGVLVFAEVTGLPTENDIFAFHIHNGADCENPGSHYNPDGTEHPHHAGDMPPLFGNDGYAMLTFYTDRFSIDEIIGKPVIIHAQRDDFTTQPSGDPGKIIACGIVEKI